MSKLWQKKGEGQYEELEKKIEIFTIGSDAIWDIHLAEADVQGSLAHAEMLESIGLLTKEEGQDLKTGLEEILKEVQEGNFKLNEGVEDIHSQVEFLLTQRKGEVGKKIHSGRSRNDQSLLDIKLFLKKEIQEISKLASALFHKLIVLSNEHKDVLLPGYTHLQIAMPSSFGLWFGAYAESLSDDMLALIAAYKIVNKNPLGSGAGYGSSFPLDREKTTMLVGMADLHYNVVYAQMTRGKTEKFTSVALAAIAATLSKFSMDVCLYMSQNFGFLTFPKALTTGSSIMPHKKNPDVFELIRAKCNRIQALPNELTLLLSNLPSGYQRDFQLTKECLFPAIFTLKDCLSIAKDMLEHIEISKDILSSPLYSNLFTVEAVNKLVLSGVPFREAYMQVSSQVEAGTFVADTNVEHTHLGSIGNLGNERVVKVFEGYVGEMGG